MPKEEVVVTLKLGDDTERLLKRLIDKFDDQDAVLKAIASLRKYVGDKFMALTGSVQTLGTLVAKVVVDGKTTSDMIVALKAELDALVAQGSANAAELAALKAEVDAAVPAIDANNALLQTLDDAVADPLQPDLDPNTPVT